MHKILYLFICNALIKILYMFQAVRCPSSGGLIVSMQHLISSLSVTYREWRYQMLHRYN